MCMVYGVWCMVYKIGINRLGGIFDDEEVMAIGNLHNTIHIACYSGIVNRDDDFGAWSDECFDSLRIQIRIALHTIGKDNLRPFA